MTDQLEEILNATFSLDRDDLLAEQERTEFRLKAIRRLLALFPDPNATRRERNGRGGLIRPAVLAALADGPLRASAVAARAKADGLITRSESPAGTISVYLGRLEKSGEVVHLEDGTWALVPEAKP